jgi:hypothetical protein
MGANAYVRTPVDEHQFLAILDQIFGTELAHGRGFNVSDELSSIDAISPIPMGEVEAVAPMADVVPIMPAAVEAISTIEVAPSSSAKTPSYAGPAIEVEDAAALYGASTPGVTQDDELAISFEAPSPEFTGQSEQPVEPAPSEDGGTREFRIEVDGAASPQLASPILATPIEAENPEAALAEATFDGVTLAGTEAPIETELGGTAPSIDFSTSAGERKPDYLRNIDSIADDQATRVAVSQIASEPSPSFDESPVEEPRFTAPATSHAAHATTSHSDDLDPDALSAMPYLGKSTQFASNPLGYREPMDDAVVPGGAANAPDVETLKKYLFLREQDVSALSAQLRQARERVSELEGQLRHEKAVTSEFAHLAQEQDRRIADFEKEKAVALEAAQKELDDVKFEMKRRNEKIRVMELQVREATEATERLKERVRNDIRKIRSREKELENRLEIMKKDSEALLAARENKIIELKRKLDLVEFNTDLLQDQLDKERKASAGLREKLAKAAQIVRVAGGILTPEEEALIAGGGSNAADASKVPAA